MVSNSHWPCTTTSLSYKVFAWDTSKNDVDKTEDGGRSYISAISEVILNKDEDCDGKAKNMMGEARMDIEHSEMAYLGFHGSEAYGLTWKVGGATLAVPKRVLFSQGSSI